MWELGGIVARNNGTTIVSINFNACLSNAPPTGKTNKSNGGQMPHYPPPTAREGGDTLIGA